MRDVTPETAAVPSIGSAFHLTSGEPADDDHPPQRHPSPLAGGLGAPAPRPLRTHALTTLFVVPLRDLGLVADSAVALTVTMFTLMLLIAAVAAFRVFSDFMYRRNRPLVFAITAEPTTEHRKSTTTPLLQAILLLMALAVIAAMIGVSSPST